MLLKVNPKTAFWGYGPYWFTFADPQPHEVNVDGLPSEVREHIIAALHRRDLIEVTADSKPVSGKLPVMMTDDVNTRRAKLLLKGGVNTVRREVSLIKDASYLSVLLSCEKASSNRKTIVSLIEKQIDKCPSVECPSTAEKLYSSLVVESEAEPVFTSNDEQSEGR